MDRLFWHQVLLEAVNQSGGKDPWSVWFLCSKWQGFTGQKFIICQTTAGDEKSTAESEDQVSVNLPLIDHVKFPTDCFSVLEAACGVEGEAERIAVRCGVAEVEPLERYFVIRGGLVAAIEFDKPQAAVTASCQVGIGLAICPSIECPTDIVSKEDLTIVRTRF